MVVDYYDILVENKVFVYMIKLPQSFISEDALNSLHLDLKFSYI